MAATPKVIINTIGPLGDVGGFGFISRDLIEVSGIFEEDLNGVIPPKKEYSLEVNPVIIMYFHIWVQARSGRCDLWETGGPFIDVKSEQIKWDRLIESFELCIQLQTGKYHDFLINGLHGNIPSSHEFTPPNKGQIKRVRDSTPMDHGLRRLFTGLFLTRRWRGVEENLPKRFLLDVVTRVKSSPTDCVCGDRRLFLRPASEYYYRGR